jgi:hypothetical protein
MIMVIIITVMQYHRNNNNSNNNNTRNSSVLHFKWVCRWVRDKKSNKQIFTDLHRLLIYKRQFVLVVCCLAFTESSYSQSVTDGVYHYIALTYHLVTYLHTFSQFLSLLFLSYIHTQTNILYIIYIYILACKECMPIKTKHHIVNLYRFTHPYTNPQRRQVLRLGSFICRALDAMMNKKLPIRWRYFNSRQELDYI